MLEQFSKIDISIIIAYLIFILFIGFRLLRDSKSDLSSFLLAGRRLSLPSFIATLVSTWYGGILGVGEFTYQYGISNWLVFGVPYYLAAAIFALFIARKARRLNLTTIPEQLERHYGKTASIIGAFFVFVTTVPAAYVLMFAVLLEFICGLPLIWGLLLGTVFSTSYVFIGGFRSVVRTDYVQFGLMFGSFMLILPVAWFQYGGWQFLCANLPATHFLWHGGNGAQYIIVWYFIALATLVEPGFYQRCFAARSEKVAQRGILFSILFWIFFDFMTTFTGLYARAILPDLQNPVTTYLALAVKLLPPVALGFFVTGLLATIMSTIDSYSFLAATTFGRDLLWRLLNRQDEIRIRKYSNIGLVISGILSIIIAYWAQSIIKIWKDLGSIGTPALVIPLVVSFSKKFKMSRIAVLISMPGSALISGLWIWSKTQTASGSYFMGIEPIYPGLLFSIFVFLIDYFLQRFYKSTKNSTLSC